MHRSLSPSPLARAIATLCLGAMASVPLVAIGQSVSTQATAPIHWNLPAEPLDQALNHVGRQAGVLLSFTSDQTRDVRGHAVSGTMTAEQALHELLKGTGLEAVPSPGGGYTLRRADIVPVAQPTPAKEVAVPSRRSVTLDETRVVATTGNYVAHRTTTGAKTDTPLIELPQTVSVITRDQIDAQQAQTLRAVLRYAPGVVISDDNDDRLDTISARGFALDQYLDGLKMLSGTWAVPKVEPYLMERAVVLEGPASVLYGQASPGGIVDIVSKRPVDTPLHEVQLQFGTNARRQANVDFGGALGQSGHWSYRLTGIYRDTDLDAHHTKERRVAIAPAITWKPDDQTRLTILASYLHDPDGGVWSMLPYQGTLLPNPNGRISRGFYTGDTGFESFKRTQYQLGYEFEHVFNETWRFRQNLRVARNTTDYSSVQGLNLQADLHTLNRQTYTSSEELRTLNIDNQAQARFDTGPVTHTLLLGVDMQRLLWDNFTRLGNAPTLDILHSDYRQAIAIPARFQDADQGQSQFGAYAQDQMRIGHWSVMLSARRDAARSDNDNHISGTWSRQTTQANTWRAGVTYLFDNGLAPYVSMSTSFQPTLGTDFRGSAFVPTRGRQKEIGVKYQPHGIDSYIALSAYELTQSNVTTPDPLHPNFNTQTGEIRSRGAELSGTAVLADGFNVRASYSYIDSELTRAPLVVQGNQQAGIPGHQASVWADYTVHDGALSGLGVGGGVRWTGKSFATVTNAVSIPSYTTIDAMVRYDLGRAHTALDGWRLAVNAANLLDKRYVSVCTAIGCRWGLRRNVMATVSYAW
ncbi:MAG: Ferrichrome outer membrane transporter/phage receptor [Luteibacter sp.]|uniref:TonB-dependent siderophore receptor n=1 Tax=Luteibacter sp. TaxID=1886636 RepID=UPI0013814D63|nr:TonB-dependent siderophore receptor [Luteibacter sp.]KAF1005602.1 MAG: Ferrichrome outer membrane transporter/phage receptor [Luteibacter sp.]